MPTGGNHTSFLERWLIKRKTSSTVTGSDLIAGEICYGDSEKSIFIKSPDNNYLYQFGRINDITSGELNSNWSSLYTKNYVDNLVDSIVIPEQQVILKTILLTAGGIAPTYSGGCGESYISDNTGTPVLLSDFTSGQSGFWNISIPGDYSGNISKISILYTGSSSACQWVIDAKVLSDAQNIITGGTWSTTYSLSDTPDSANKLQKVELSSTINLFGSSSNVGNFASIRIKLNSGTGTYNLLQVKLEY